ncbi:hypothetical protein [Schlesneria sp.]|uniref:hypothetical protein n=1 Tax=Schlesneria sp. TaxID=2762018 RepID=UPI002EE276A8
MRHGMFYYCAALIWLSSVTIGQAADWGLKEGTPDIKSAGTLAFGPDGILFVGDSKGAAIFAIGTGDTKGDPSSAKPQIAGLNKQIASLLESTVENITVNDLATNPLTGTVYLSVTKGKGEHASPAIVRIGESNQLSELSLKKVPFQKAVLPDAPEDKEVTVNGRTRNPRNDAITDLAYAEGKVFASGLAAGASPSSVHQIPFPFADGLTGTSVEIYHGAHGRVEDYAAIRTFVPMNINGEPSLLAGFVCTPLVRFPINDLKNAEKARGTTVAELGNRNQPLDMIAYKQNGRDYLLLSNSARGVMKISTENIATTEGITSRVADTAGQSYETVKELNGVVQLDRLNEDNVVVLIQSTDGSQDLRTVPLP